MNRRPSLESTANRISGAADALGRAIARRFEVDLRALAAFRIALGALLLVDLALRSRSLVAFYTDYGVLPREALFSDYAGVYSLHALSGDPGVIALLFAVAGAFALAMIVGYRTRVATAVSWLLLFSLHVRNPMVLNAGDTLLRLLVFWAIFLPLGARWSVDAASRAESRAGTDATVVSVATMAVLLQVVLMYATNAIHKARSELWMDGEAVRYIMQADQFTAHLGNHITEFQGLLRVVTVVWVALLFASPLLVLLTGRRRSMLATAYVGMHLGMAASMRLGIFPVAVVVGFIPFYGPTLWDAAERLASRTGLSGTLVRACERVRRRLPSGPAIPDFGVRPQLPDRGVLTRSVDRGRVLFSTVLPWFFLVLVVLSNAQAVDYTDVPDPAEDVLETAELDQSWRMFAPNPIHTTNWFAAPGTLADGREVDVMHDRSVRLDRPADVDATYPTARWRKYLGTMAGADNENHRSYLANYLCDGWNRSHETDVRRVTVYRSYERTDPAGRVEASGTVTLVEYDCSGDLVQ